MLFYWTETSLSNRHWCLSACGKQQI